MYKFKAIISDLIIAFFYSAFVVFLLILFFGSFINKGLSILNTFSLNLDYGSNENVEFDPIKKSLIVQPSWGTVFGKIKIPSISVDLDVYHGDDTVQLANGVGHSPGTRFPGEGGTIIMAAHNDRRLFYRLPEIKSGDIITLETIYGTFKYKAYDFKVVNAKNDDAFPIQNDEEILILYTCYPVNSIWYARDRYLVFAKLVGDEL